MATETVPPDIDKAIVALMSAMKGWALGSFGNRETQLAAVSDARAALDAAILGHLRDIDDLKATLDRIASGGV